MDNGSLITCIIDRAAVFRFSHSIREACRITRRERRETELCNVTMFRRVVDAFSSVACKTKNTNRFFKFFHSFAEAAPPHVLPLCHKNIFVLIVTRVFSRGSVHVVPCTFFCSLRHAIHPLRNNKKKKCSQNGIPYREAFSRCALSAGTRDS